MFSRKEKRYFSDPYFRIIREEEQFVEIQSLNTTQCWNIFKNQFEHSKKITLYHKHKETDAYYHKHGQCSTVGEAVKQIKDHDEYVIEQDKLRNSKVEKESVPKKRHLKVHETSGYKYKPTPTIIMKGEWLKEYGFESGDKVNITCDKPGVIVITRDE